MLTTKSSAERLGPDLQIFPSGPTASEQGTCVHLLIALMQPESRGQMFLAAADPRVPPRIDSRLLTHPADATRLHTGLRLARSIAASRPLATHLTEELWPGPEIQSEHDLITAIREPATTIRFSSYQHGVGTCRMGPRTDRMSVVDSMGSLHGTAGQHVVDASIMPTIPTANTNVPTMMLAERIVSTWA